MKKIEHDIKVSELLFNYLHGDLSDDENKLLDAWLEVEENRQFFETIKNSHFLYNGLSEMRYIDTSSRYARLKDHIVRTRIRRFYTWFSGVAAIFLICLILWHYWNENTEIYINPNSGMSYDNNRTILTSSCGDITFVEDSLLLSSSEVQDDTNKVTTSHNKKEDISSERDNETKVVDSMNTLRTANHDVCAVTLYDGTKVWLNGDSELRFPDKFSMNTRTVYLNGEAYFEVAKDLKHPFEVIMPDLKIKVLGTSFNVNYEDDKTCTTTLVEGRITISNSLRDTLSLFPGQQLRVHDRAFEGIEFVDDRYVCAWRNNQFAFNSKPLINILQDIAKWYNIRFMFVDNKIAHNTYTTIIHKYDNVASVLDVLSATEEFYFQKNGNIYEVRSRK